MTDVIATGAGRACHWQTRMLCIAERHLLNNQRALPFGRIIEFRAIKYVTLFI